MRYTGEVRFRFIGSREECIRHIPDARKVLGLLHNQDRVLGGLDLAHRKVRLPSGATVIVDDLSPLPILTIIAPKVVGADTAHSEYILLTTWAPEGILLTPKTAAAPDGWGLPLRDSLTGALPEKDPEAPPEQLLGTLGGSLPQVLLNRYPNNRHFDNPKYILGDLPSEVASVRDAYEDFLRRPRYADPVNTYGVMHVAWVQHPKPSSYADPQGPEIYFDTAVRGAEPGIYKGSFDAGLGLFTATELVVSQAVLGEVSTVGWHAHRAEDLLYYSLTQEGIFLRVNEVRIAVGEAPLYRPVRGYCDPALLSALEVGRSEANSFAHSHPDFSPGYRTAGGRLANAVGFAVGAAAVDNPAENLLTYTVGLMDDPVGSVELGVSIADSWIASPPHYERIISSAWSENTAYPKHSWEPQGTRGASMYAQFYQPAEFTTSGVISGPETWGVEPIFANNMVVWAQTFVAQETWLPAYDKVVEHHQGLIGLFCGTNPLNRVFATKVRRFGLGRSIYELPKHVYEPRDRPADFLCIAGAAPFIRGGNTWLRVVYWESSEQLEEQPVPGGEYLTLRVALIPASLCEAGNLPWRYALPPVWEPEFTYTFEHSSGYMPYPENYVHFSSTGEDFVFEVERIASQWVSEGLAGGPGQPFNRFSMNNILPMPYPAAALERKAFRYSSTHKSITLLLPAQTPLRATVNATTTPDPEDSGLPIHRYERAVRGQYKIWPHFDENDNVQFVTLDIDEYQIQRGNTYEFAGDIVNPGAAFEDIVYDNTANGRPWYGWRIRKMIFPGGKEFLYLQQYVWQYRSVEFVPEDRLPVYDVFPGTGENFYTIIHHIDIPTASMIYSKHGSVMTRMPAPSNSASWYLTGDNTYYIDALLCGERVTRQIAHYPKPTPDELRPYLTIQGGIYGWDMSVTRAYPVSLYNISYFDTYREWTRLYGTADLYDFTITPRATRRQEIHVGRDGYNNTIKQLQLTTTGKSAPLPGNGFMSNSLVSPEACYYDFFPVNDYFVSCFSGYDYIGETNTSHAWVARAAAGRTAFCGFWHNIAPMFSKGEVQAKFVEYDGRWVVRLKISHIGNGGWRPPDPWYENFPLETPNEDVYKSFSLWTYREPSDKITNWTGRDDLTGSAVHLLANFDIDEAADMVDVVDIEPFGRVG